MKKIILTTILFLTTLFSFGQYFVIGEMDSENQADSMKFLDLWMNGIKDVVGEDLNMNIFQSFLKATDFKGARLYELMPEYSNMDGYFAMSTDEKKEYKYRRVVHHNLTDSGEQAFLANQKFWIDADKKLGVDYYYALMKPVFATDSDFMLVLLDKTRFDYHKNWSDRMDKRFSDPDFNNNYEQTQQAPVSSVVDEWNLTLLDQYSY